MMILAALLASSSLALAADGQPAAGSKAPPPPAKVAPSSQGPTIQQHTTKTGLTVLVAENHALPLVTVEIALRNGSMTEPPEFNGLSHLYEHMFFKANAVLPSQEAYMARVNELGIRFNGTTGTERVNYFFTTTTDHGEEAMEFMRDAILTLSFDAKELEKEREVVTGEMDRAEANPYFWFGRALDEKVWYRYPTRKNPLGSRQTVLGATPKMMRAIQQRYYHPNNAVLVVAGDVTADKIFAQADQLYAGWKRGPDPFKRFPLAVHPPLKKSEVVMLEKPVRTYVGQFVWHGPSTVKKELAATYAADALGTYVSEPTSRFQRALVESGACLGAGLSWFTQRNVGPITVRYAATPDKIDVCTKAIVQELSKLAEPGYISAEELAEAAHTLEIDKIKERETPSAFAHVITFWWASAGLDYYQSYVENVRKVTPKDVTQFVTHYMKNKPFVYGGLASAEMTKAGATSAHLAELVGVANKGAAR